jgi:zinc transporter ZupT
VHIKNLIHSLSSRCLNISSKIRNYASYTSLIVKNLNVYHKDFAKETLEIYSDFLGGVKEVALRANDAANENLKFFDL